MPHQSSRAQVETSLLRLMEQQSALEGVAATAETVAALAAGAAASRATMAQLGPEQVDAIYDDMAEAAEEARLVQDALAVPLGAAAELDDAELEAELQVGWSVGGLGRVGRKGASRAVYHPFDSARERGQCELVVQLGWRAAAQRKSSGHVCPAQPAKPQPLPLTLNSAMRRSWRPHSWRRCDWRRLRRQQQLRQLHKRPSQSKQQQRCRRCLPRLPPDLSRRPGWRSGRRLAQRVMRR